MAFTGQTRLRLSRSAVAAPPNIWAWTIKFPFSRR